MTDLSEFLERRALAFCLAGRLAGWPDDLLHANAQALAESMNDGDEFERQLTALALASNRDALESSYVELFENGPRRSPIHETEYGRMRGLSKGTDLADVEGFYLAFGLSRHNGGQVMADHLGVELEFYGTVLAKLATAHECDDSEGVSVLERALQLFLEAHLGRFAGAVARQPAIAEHPHYGRLFATIEGLVASESERLGLTLQPLVYLPTLAEPEVCCGTTIAQPR